MPTLLPQERTDATTTHRRSRRCRRGDCQAAVARRAGGGRTVGQSPAGLDLANAWIYFQAARG